MFSNFQQRFPMQDLRQWVPLLDMDPEAMSAGPPDAETLLETFLPGSVYGLYQKGDMFARPFWAIPPTKVFQTLPIPSILSVESIPLPKINLVPSFEPELPIAAPRASIFNDIPARVQTPTLEVPTIRKKISTPCFTRPSTPTRPGTPTTRPSSPVDVRSSLPHPQKSNLGNTLSGSFSSVKKSPSVRDFLGTAANFAKEAKSKSVPQKEASNVSVNPVPLEIPTASKVPSISIPLGVSAPPNVSIAPVNLERSISLIEVDDCLYMAPYKQEQEPKKQMALVQYHSPVIQLPFSGPIQNGTCDAYDASLKEPSYTTQQNFLGSTHIKPSKEEFGITADPQRRALVSQYLKKLQTKAAKVQSQFSPAAVPNTNISTGQQNSLVRVNRAFGNYRSFDSQNGSTPEIYVDPRYQSYVHHFLKKSVWKTAAAGSSRSIKELMQELRKDSIFLNTIAPGAILQALDDAVVARLRQSLSVQDSNSAVARFCDASARMDDLRRFLESLTKDNGQCVDFEHWIEEIPEDSEQTLPIDFASGTQAIRSTPSGPKAFRDAVRRRMETFRQQSSKESKFTFDTPVAQNDTPLKRSLCNKDSTSSLRLYKRTRNGSSEDVSLRRSKGLSIITTSNEKFRAISNSSIRELILSPINSSSTQIDGQISDTLFIESLVDHDSSPSTPTSTTGSGERWDRSSTLSRLSMRSLESAQTGVTVPNLGPTLSLGSEETLEKNISERGWDIPVISIDRSPHTEQTCETHREDIARSCPVPAYSRFLTPKKCRSVSELTFDSPKEYRAESLKRSFSSTSSLSKFSITAPLPALLSPPEPQIVSDEEISMKDSSEILDVTTRIEELVNPVVLAPAPEPTVEPWRAGSGSNSDGHKSAQGLLKELAAVAEDVKKDSRKTTVIKDVKTTTNKDVEEEFKGVEEKKKNKLFGRLKDRVKGLKKKVSGAMKGGKEN